MVFCREASITANGKNFEQLLGKWTCARTIPSATHRQKKGSPLLACHFCIFVEPLAHPSAFPTVYGTSALYVGGQMSSCWCIGEGVPA
ncbi:hypothetical protein AVEN_218587-1 [Araneus ventricosus]|uniref:Uncharacterized protein n=1 Tax=Araneus ventricosus TaxID=182803 RepID=A0A4Y2L4F1_ARAVE|nr:hypothetical protein AVEN_218587-1 [Araneus ventricosus]